MFSRIGISEIRSKRNTRILPVKELSLINCRLKEPKFMNLKRSFLKTDRYLVITLL